MCGIFSILGYIDHSQILKYFYSIKNRGPDTSSIFMKDDLFIGFHRLSINDLSVHGQQPFLYNDGEDIIAVVCNGEIYNHTDLKKEYELDYVSHSDCAVIYPLFKKLDYDFKELNKRLNGEYAMTIYRITPTKTYFYASTDPLSVRPLFYSMNSTSFATSSLMKGLLFTKSVHRLEQGMCLMGYYENGMVHFIDKTLYVESPPIIYKTETQQLYEKIVYIFTECVKKRIHNMDTDFCCLLSGGLDSSLVSAVAQRLSNKPIKTFTIGSKGSPDVEYAQKVADHIGSDHHVIEIDLDNSIQYIDDVIKTLETFDITTIRASTGQYLISKYISENTDIKVVLNGDGADEVQMGYLYFFSAPCESCAHSEQKRLLSEIHLYDGLRVDRCISHNGLEARLPFLDFDFVRLFDEISASIKIPKYKGMEKYLIRKAFEEVYKNDPILPASVLWRKKEAFSDGISKKEKSWYQILQDYFNEKISDEDFEKDKQNYTPVPLSKEAYYYRKMYEKYFGNHTQITEYWMPKWSKTNDPSARTLKVYDQ